MAEKAVNYTDGMIEQMLTIWENPVEGETQDERLERIAKTVGRELRSVRAKLVQMRVYTAKPKPIAKRAAEGPSKKELLNLLADNLPFDVTGLEPANKGVLSDLLDFVQARVEPAQEQDTQD